MSKLTIAQKHDLITRFNEQREEMYNQYQTEKEAKKTEMAQSGTAKQKTASEYTKLYKQLGSNNTNKDVRRQLQEEVDMYTDNQLSTNMNINMIPGYSMNKYNQISSFKDTFQGKTEEPVDKIYFRQKDEINQYSEAYFTSKHILSSKKWNF